MMKVPSQRITFSPNDQEEILQRIGSSLSTGQVAQGRYVQEFEDTFAKHVNAKYAIAVSSGGAAIGIGMRLLEVQGKEILVPVNTFVATATEIMLAGGSIRFVDTDPATFSVSLNALQEAKTPRTVGVIIVHIGGIINPEIEEIQCWCKDQGLWLFEDAAHAHGSEFNGKQAGKFGCMAAYSFFATKVITSGEGGMLVTDNQELAERAKCFRDYGKPQPWVSYHTEIGSNWRLSEFSAAVGVVHLKRMEEFISWRQKVADFYTFSLQSIKSLTLVLPASKCSWYKYIILLPPNINRSDLRSIMKDRGVSLPGGVYEIPLHQQPIFQCVVREFPIANDICSRHICLPIFFGLTEEETNYVVTTLRQSLAEIGVVL
jgi:dTDP-4-amino-4,6-dideoxygalactose transaminase